MTGLPLSPEGGAYPAANARVAVWDWPVRVVHWSMVLLFVLLLITGLRGGDALQWHMRFGQARRWPEIAAIHLNRLHQMVGRKMAGKSIG